MTPTDRFLETFEVGGEVEGEVTKRDFVAYYTAVSPSIGADEEFDRTLRDVWHVEEREQDRGSVEKNTENNMSTGNQTVSETQAPASYMTSMESHVFELPPKVEQAQAGKRSLSMARKAKGAEKVLPQRRVVRGEYFPSPVMKGVLW